MKRVSELFHFISMLEASEKPNLVLDLDETIVYCTRVKTQNESIRIRVGRCAFYIQTRPGLLEFLQTVSEVYNVYIFTASEKVYADAVINAIAPFIPMDNRFYKTHINYAFGCAVKDLERLGFPLTHTILVDDCPSNAIMQQENSIFITPWMGQQDDEVLLCELVPLLLNIANKGSEMLSELFDGLENQKGIYGWNRVQQNKMYL